jgi:cytoskeleton protein RodZ
MDDNAQPPAAAGASAPAERNVGEMLKTARAALGLTLEQIATELRIEIRQLQALEDDRFDVIGVPVFIKGYLRQYGQRIGLDYRDLLAQYYKQTSLQDVQIRPSKTIKLRDERQITVWLIAALALLVVVAGLAAWWLGGGGFDIGRLRGAAPQPKPDAKPAATALAEPAVSAPPTTSTREPAPELAAGGGAASPTEPNANAQAAAAPPPAATFAPARTSSTRAGPTAPAPSPPPASAANVAPASASAAAPSFVVPLELTFEQESWAEVADARGTRLYYGLGTAGRRAEMRGEPPFAVVLGNAAGVKVVVDGEEFKIPTKGRPGEYARFSVDVATD